MSSFKKLPLLMSGVALAFSGSALAQPIATQNDTSPLAYTELKQFVTGPCQQDRCAQLQVSTVQFDKQEAFSRQVNQKLLSMASSLTEKPAGFDSVDALIKNFERHATWRTSEFLEADVLRNQHNLVVLNLEHYIDTGGAHGEPSSQYVNWLTGAPAFATLETMLLPNAQAAFEARLKAQHQKWLAEQKKQGNIDNIDDFVKTWPFATTDNVALMPNGLTVTFAKYVLGPGSMGQPSLTIPYSELQGVLKPEFLKAGRS